MLQVFSVLRFQVFAHRVRFFLNDKNGYAQKPFTLSPIRFITIFENSQYKAKRSRQAVRMIFHLNFLKEKERTTQSLLELTVSVFPGCVVCVYGGSERSNNSVNTENQTCSVNFNFTSRDRHKVVSYLFFLTCDNFGRKKTNLVRKDL